MSAPVIWIVIPAILALLLLFIPTKKFQLALFFIICVILFLATIVVKIDSIGGVRFYEFDVPATLQILGRRFVLPEESKGLIRIVFAINAFFAGIVFFLDQKSRLIPLGLLFSCLLLAAYSVEPFLYSALIIEIAVLVSIPILYDQNADRNTGGLRYLTLQTLGMPFILLTGWFLAGGEITPVGQEQLIQAVVLLGLGFMSWLAIFPLHAWVPMLFEETRAIDSGYVFQMFFLFLFLIMLKFFNNFVWFREYAPVIQAFRVLGAFMCILGSAGSYFSQSPQKKNGYILLHIIGILTVSVGIMNESDISMFSQSALSLWAGFTLLTISSAYIQSDLNQTTSPGSQNQSAREFLGSLGLIIAQISIAGMPLSIGFSSTQNIYLTSAKISNVLIVLLIVSKLIISVVSFNNIAVLVIKNQWSLSDLNLGKKELAFLLVLIFFIIAGIFPGLSLPVADDLISGFQNLIQ